MTNKIYVGDVGWSSHEEINVLEKGKNFGWACYEGPLRHLDYDCYSPDLVEPLFYMDHPVFKSISGGFVYRGSKYPSWSGKYFFGDFITRTLCYLDEGQAHCWDSSNNNTVNQKIVTFGEDRSKELYISDLLSGDIFRLDTLALDCGVTAVDSLSITFVTDSLYTSLEYISIDTIVHRDLILRSSEVDLKPMTSVIDNVSVTVESIGECIRRKYGIIYEN